MAGDLVLGRFDRPVSASALARLARCERQLLFDLAHAPRRTPAVAAAARRGIRHHEQHHRAVQCFHRRPAPAAADRSCFIATAVYGETAWQTEYLRRYRDRVLRRHLLGRVLVRGYECLSPPLARWLYRRPELARRVARRLDRLVRRINVDRPGQTGRAE